MPIRLYNRAVVVALTLACSVFGACAWFRTRPPATSESIEFVADAEVVAPGDSLMLVRVVARNEGSLTWALQLGQCSLNIRVATLPPAAAHEWEYGRWRRTSNPRALCLADLEAVPVPPGKSVTTDNLQRIVRVRDVLGDSLPGGRYRVTATLEFNNMIYSDIAAGEVELRAR